MNCLYIPSPKSAVIKSLLQVLISLQFGSLVTFCTNISDLLSIHLLNFCWLLRLRISHPFPHVVKESLTTNLELGVYDRRVWGLKSKFWLRNIFFLNFLCHHFRDLRNKILQCSAWDHQTTKTALRLVRSTKFSALLDGARTWLDDRIRIHRDKMIYMFCLIGFVFLC